MDSGIYILRSKSDPELFYIGSSNNLSRRKRDHRNRDSSHHRNDNLYNHKVKYGYKDLVFSVIEYCKTDFLYEKEQYYISELSPPLNTIRFASIPTPGSARNYAYEDFIKFGIPNLVAMEATILCCFEFREEVIPLNI